MEETERITLFADVIVPLPVPAFFTYRVPYEMNKEIVPGLRAIVQFGKKKVYAAIVREIHQNIPANHSPKYILGLLDEKPVVGEKQLRFWDWIAQYYMCHPGEVMAAALPGALKLASESRISLHEGFRFDSHALTDNEFLITEALGIQPQLSLTEVTQIVGFQKVMPLIKTMMDKNIIVMEEEMHEKFKAKTERIATINELYKDEKLLSELMDRLSKKAYKQLEILLVYLRGTRFPQQDASPFPINLLLEQSGATAAQFKTLVQKNVFAVSERIVSRLPNYAASQNPDQIQLTDHQITAFNEIKQQFEQKDVVLLHGVTSSGKTELYIKLIAENLRQGKQVLYLLPEIALTTQIIERLKTYFGNKVGVYHSRYNANEKVEVWNKVLSFDQSENNDHQIILGPRSALFLPFSKLGLIIIDEEHDSSFKQYEPAPRYQARDMAIVLAGMFGSKVLLGSATPSFESYYNAQTDKYGLVVMTKRYGDIRMPEISIVNMREEKKRKTLQSHFSSVLMKEMKTALSAGEQVILFQNRRGFSLRLECDQCNWIPQCKNCDVSLIYHKKQNMLRCHYCGYANVIPESCPDCGSTAIKMHGFGTEKVEEELGLLITDKQIARLDLDTTRSKFAFQEIFEAFASRKTQILVGTQMVTKGLDFDNVSVVGVLNADNMLSYPDFRAFERSFQLMAQVSGRAGRKHKQGKVIIQTFQPKHQMMGYVINNDYERLFYQQMPERKKFHYPPYFRLIHIQLLHRDNNLVNLAAFDLAKMLRANPAYELLGPEYPIVSRIKTLYIKQIIIKYPKNPQVGQIKKFIAEKINTLLTNVQYKSLRVHLDVDPQS